MLDVLRGVAVLLVFCYHSRVPFAFSRFGWAGVDQVFDRNTASVGVTVRK